MSYFEYTISEPNNENCKESKDRKYFICTLKQDMSNQKITTGVSFGEMGQGKSYYKSLNYAFNDVIFANNVDTNNITNIDNCINDECKNKITFAKTEKLENDMFSIFNDLENKNMLNKNLQTLNNVCQKFNVCNYKSDNTFLLKKNCNNNLCKYDIYCECHKD